MRMLILSGLLCAVLLQAGCSALANASTVREYNADGQLIKETVTSESIVKDVIASTKDKMVFVSDQSVIAYVDVSLATYETPTPSFTMLFGRKDKVFMTLPTAMRAYTKYMPALVDAARAGEVAISPTSGIGMSTANTDTEGVLK